MMTLSRHPQRFLASLLAVGLAACGAATAGEPIADLREIDSPAGSGSGEPNLFALDGRVFLSWLEPAGGERFALRFATWEANAWSEPRTIAEGEGFFVNWADFPSLVALPDGRLAAHWLVRSGPATFAYDVYIAQSADGGQSWSAPIVPHRDGTQTEHGFVSLFAAEQGRLGAVWLDGRNFAGADGTATHTGADMTLRHATLGEAGDLGDEVVLDERVCDCCQTAAARTSRGMLVAYRNRSPDELRDIYSVLLTSNGPSTPRRVHADGWQIPGCPVNGPALAADGDRAVVAWFTAAADTPRVRLAFSEDGGTSFGAAIRADDGDPLGRVHVLLLEDGSALLSWLERVGEAAEIRLRRVRPDGSASSSVLISPTGAQRASGFPRMARSGGQLVFAWTDPAEPRRVRTALAAAP